MKKRNTVICALIFVFILGGSITYMFFATSNDNHNLEEWTALIVKIEAARVSGPKSVLEDMSQTVDTLEEANKLMDEYENNLDSICTKEQKENYLEMFKDYPTEVDMREDVIDDSNKYYSELVEAGVFEVKILDYDIGSNSAEVYALVTSWGKTISQYSDSIFHVEFPVNKSVKNYKLRFEDDSWKFDGYTLASEECMDGDYVLEQELSSYEEAVTYAQSVEVTNVLANSEVKMTK